MKGLQKTKLSRILSLLLLLLLTAAIAISAASCDDTDTNGGKETPATSVSEEGSDNPQTTEAQGGAEASPEVRGEGNTEFVFKVVTARGELKSFTVKTDKKKVGEALVDAGLIAGEQGAYGLYVKTVDGETLDYDTDGKYWAFYVDGEYAMSGVDTTDIESGKEYSFKAE